MQTSVSSLQVDQVLVGTFWEMNITLQIDPEGSLSVGRHFLTIVSYTIYKQRMPGGGSETIVGPVESVTVNFTVDDGTENLTTYADCNTKDLTK